MSFADFEVSVMRDPAPSGELSRALLALWHDGRGEWKRAHACVQDEDDAVSAWVHAYLHRKEGDQSNAAYWYARAGKPRVAASMPLEMEWAQIARVLIDGS